MPDQVRTMEQIREAALVRLEHLSAAMQALRRCDTNMKVASDEIRNAWSSFSIPRDQVADTCDAFPALFDMLSDNIKDDALNTAEQIGKLLARDFIAPIARTSDTPVAWLTGNQFMPPLRSLDDAERVYQADDDGDIWQAFFEAVDRTLDEEKILMECPEHDNALYVVDLNRFDHVADEDMPEHGDGDINDEWYRIGS